jgi:hypothetical protein
MDEEDDRDFSKSIVFGFLEQADQTFGKMDAAMYVPYIVQISEQQVGTNAMSLSGRRKTLPSSPVLGTSSRGHQQH